MVEACCLYLCIYLLPKPIKPLSWCTMYVIIINVLHASAVGVGFIPTLAAARKSIRVYVGKSLSQRRKGRKGLGMYFVGLGWGWTPPLRRMCVAHNKYTLFILPKHAKPLSWCKGCALCFFSGAVLLRSKLRQAVTSEETAFVPQACITTRKTSKTGWRHARWSVYICMVYIRVFNLLYPFWTSSWIQTRGKYIAVASPMRGRQIPQMVKENCHEQALLR